jgi:membrane associated rhomboid family serine protease
MRDTTLQFSLPPFRGAVRHLIFITLGVWIAFILLSAFYRPGATLLVLVGMLDPERVLHGQVWQLLTYAFVHTSPLHVIFVLIGVYFIGSAVQERVGSRAFAELYLFSSVLAAVIGVLLSLTKKVGAGPAIGAGAAVNAVLMVFFLLHRGVSILLIPFPFRIPVEWVVVAVGGIETAYFVLTGFSLFYLVQLLGLGTGYLWYRFMWRRATVSGVVSDRIGGIRNSYYRWKRERAKKKFQVYMRKHQQDPKQYFDEYGNFRPPDEQEKEKKDRGGSGGWVN